MQITNNYVAFFLETLARLILVDPSDLSSSVKSDADEKLARLFEQIKNRKLAVIPHVIYVNKSISGLTELEFFATDDTKSKGLRNIAYGKLDEGQYFCPAIVQLLAGDLGATPSDTLLRAEPYDDIFNAGGNLNSGEFTLKVNTNEILMKDCGMSAFVTASSSELKGAHILPKSTIMKPGFENSAMIKLGSAAATNLGAGLRLHGAATVPLNS